MMESTGTIKRGTGGKAAVAAFASAALLLPAELADGATRISKKFAKRIAAKAKLNPKQEKKLERSLKRREVKLRQRFRQNPDLIREAKPEPLVLGLRVQREKGKRGKGSRDMASASSVVGTCAPLIPTAIFRRIRDRPPDADDAIAAGWASLPACAGWPVFIAVGTDMKDPSGRHHQAEGAGWNIAAVHDSARGPKGPWYLQNKAIYAAKPPAIFGPTPPNCVGSGTGKVACYTPKVFPT